MVLLLLLQEIFGLLVEPVFIELWLYIKLNCVVSRRDSFDIPFNIVE